jgi:WD40 repeat protein
MKTAIVSALMLFLVCSGCTKPEKPQDSLEVAAIGLHNAALDHTGEHALVGSIYHGLSYWRTADKERLYNWNHKPEQTTTLISADFSDDNKWALSADPHTMVLWQTSTGKGERFWTAPAQILDVELNRNGTLALLGLEDHSAVIFDIRRGGIRRTFHHLNRVRSVDLSEDGTKAITGSEDYSVAIWDTRSGEQVAKLMHEDDVQLVRLSDDGELALSVSKYDRAIVFKVTQPDIAAEIPLRAENVKRGIRFTSARFNKDNTLLLTGRPDQIVQLWSISEDEGMYLQELARWKLPKRRSWKPSGAAVLDVAFTSDSNRFAAIASNGFVHQLNLPASN